MTIKDFTRRRDVTFSIDDDLFEGVPGIPAERMLEYGSTVEQLGVDLPMEQQSELFRAMITLLLKPDSAARFIARMSDAEHPIDVTQIMDVTSWLMEQYGLRPTQPSSSSPSGQPSLAPGTSSTDVAYLPDSTLGLSPQTVS